MTIHDPLTERIIGCAYRVANTLGHGFLEKVYENALAHEIRKVGLNVTQQRGMEVHYDGLLIGEFVADLVVEGRVIVELKAVRALDDIHVAQCLNYLKAMGLETCLLINFGRARLEIRRLSLSRGMAVEEVQLCCSANTQRRDEKIKAFIAADGGDGGDGGDDAPPA